MIPAGSTVKIHYKLLVDGDVIDSSEGKAPLTYTQGSGELVEGLEERLTELEEGVQAHVVVPPDKGYGQRDPGAIRSVRKDAFREPDTLQPGSVIQAQTEQGKVVQVRVLEVGEENVTLDLNHPLAGKTLEFQIEVVEVSP